MAQVSLTGNDTISFAGTVLTAFPDGDSAELTFPNDLTTVRAGKNGNTIYALNAAGTLCQLVLRVLRGSADHKMLAADLAAYLQSVPSYILHKAKIVKNIGDGQGNITADIYNLAGLAPTKIPPTTSNVSGDEAQTIAVFTYMGVIVGETLA